jgi:hypothetical protein
MRLLLYLVALIAGLSPAEARNAAFAAPVSVGVQASASYATSAPKKAHQQMLAAHAPRAEEVQISAGLPHFALITSPLPRRATPRTDRLLE